MTIHPTAIVDKDAEIGKDVEIGPYCIIEGGTQIGDGTKLLQNVYVARGTTIGKSCQIHMNAIIGHEPQDIAFGNKPSFLKIGDRNIIRELVTIHRGTGEGSSTVIGDDNFFMAVCHIAHNCNIGNKIVVCNNSLLAGHVEVGDMAFISGNCVVHQFVRIGRLTMVSGSARLSKDVPPYMVAEHTNFVASYNIVGLRRAGFGPKLREDIKKAFTILYRSELNIKTAAERIESEFDSPELKHFVEFIRASGTRGICSFRTRRAIEV